MGAFEEVFGVVALLEGRDPEGGLRKGLTQPFLHYSGVGGDGVREGDDDLRLVGVGDEVRGAQGIERPADVPLFPATLHAQSQHGERQVELGGEGDLLPECFLERLDGLKLFFGPLLAHKNQYRRQPFAGEIPV